MKKTANKSHLWPGVPLALVSAMLFGVSAPFSKMLLASLLYFVTGTAIANEKGGICAALKNSLQRLVAGASLAGLGLHLAECAKRLFIKTQKRPVRVPCGLTRTGGDHGINGFADESALPFCSHFIRPSRYAASHCKCRLWCFAHERQRTSA